ncbi:PAS domain-containing protein [Edaphobacter aggregans]|uniref:PAS domain-containing protein n=1 Tax=Edaphobacter aggregans TaxID=570835 RepID=UPI00068BAC0A|nr:PAS domain-containing protein [Edaphobacter aggregans]
MDDVKKPKDGASPSGKAARMIALISSVDINSRLTFGFVLIIALMSVGIGILFWQSRVMRTQANRLKEMDEQFMEVQRVRVLVLSFHEKSEQLVKARDLARLQQEAPTLRNQLNDSLRQTKTLFRGVHLNNILDPTVLPTLEVIQGSLPSQVDSLTSLASIGDWEGLRRRLEQPLEALDSLSAELVDTVSRDLQDKRSEAARQIERAQIRTLFILTAVGGLTIVIAALLGLGITQSITRPLRSLVDAASALAKGEFGQQLSVQGRDELAHLSRVFNQTTIKLQQLYENLRRSEQELRTILEIMPAYVGTSLPDGTVDFLSESWLNYSGLSREQGLGWGWGGTIHPEHVDRVLGNWQAALATGKPVEQELRCRSADGTYHWFLNRSLPLRDEGGNVVKWYGILFDIDALKETENALQTREHQLLGIIETIPSKLWSTSPAGEPTHLSKRFLEYLGAPFEEIVNRGWESFIHADDREETAKAFFRAIDTGESYSAIHRLRRADGEYRWHHNMGEPLRDPQGKIIQWYGLSVDIDARKRAEDYLRDTRIKLNRASKIATVAELSASIAHELNQPLMAVLGNAQAARRWLAANPPNLTETNASIERILRDIRSADETMQHIRALFKRESFEKREANIPDIIGEAVRLVHEDPNKRNVPIDRGLDDDLPKVSVDPIQIQQVFINLISNAIEAMEDTRTLPLVRIRPAITDQNEMLIQVIDNGPGVDDTERIFDTFMTTKEKGMGMGLAVSRSIVEAHGGRLWAENNRNGGATFSVALPLSSVIKDPVAD